MKRNLKLFFDSLEVYEDQYNNQDHKRIIRSSLNRFLKNQTVSSAKAVYTAFFNAYWVGIQHEKNPFVELTTILNKYEEYSGRIVDKHRDHYVHSVNVFILGLSIYAGNSRMQIAFTAHALNRKAYPDCYSTNNEEFFYRWGLAALFHDIAYPLELSLKQANRYLGFIWEYPEKTAHNKKIRMDIPDFNEFITVTKLKPSKNKYHKYYHKYPFFKDGFNGDILDLLSQAIAASLNLPKKRLRNCIKKFVDKMIQDSFVDHGFYSAVIMTRWYYFLIKTTDWNPAYFYFPVIDSASAILLHNFYKRVLMSPPFSVHKMRANEHPIAFLLILCDELQEWGRRGYGEKDAPINNPDNVNLKISNSRADVEYRFANNKLLSGFSTAKKKKSVYEVLEYKTIFPHGIHFKTALVQKAIR